MTTVLVAGADRVDAGKTTFTRGLVHRLSATGFKPRAGNDYWFHHDAYRAAIAEGRLFGGDARAIADASPGGLEPEAINPVHRLWMPAPAGDGFIGPGDRTFLLDRVGDDFVVNAAADLPASAADALPLDDATRVRTIGDLNRVTEERHLPAISDLVERIRTTDPAVVESYGDVARPARELVPDRVAVVEPLRVRVYDGGRYDDACEVATGSPRDGRLEERVGDVVDLIGPAATAVLPPLSSGERGSAAEIADAYADAYDRLLGTEGR